MTGHSYQIHLSEHLWLFSEEDPSRRVINQRACTFWRKWQIRLNLFLGIPVYFSIQQQWVWTFLPWPLSNNGNIMFYFCQFDKREWFLPVLIYVTLVITVTWYYLKCSLSISLHACCQFMSFAKIFLFGYLSIFLIYTYIYIYTTSLIMLVTINHIVV